MCKLFLFSNLTKQIHILLIWLFLVVISMFSRSLVPIDETRYVTVAWNMYLNHNYLVPYLNDLAYSHKPPLLFWLINIGWQIFGINEWWPRLIPSFFSLGAILLTQKIARRLWPSRQHIAYISSLILLGSCLWAVFTTAMMFDMLVAFFTTWGAWGILCAWQGEAKRGWTYFALAIGGGLLAKGPTILLQVLPLALLAPWWGKKSSTQPKLWLWYVSLSCALCVGIIIVLAWAIPAGFSGGLQYQHEIFWGQTVHRLVNSFAHQRPVYWYLPRLPIILFPWLFALPVWRALAKIPLLVSETGVRFCIAWLTPILTAFSFISGKQLHYLLPIIPAFSLWVARGLEERQDQLHALDRVVPALIGSALGSALLYLPYYYHPHYLTPWITNIPISAGLTLIIGSLILMFTVQDKYQYIKNLSLLGILVISILYLGIIRAAGPAYNLTTMSQKLKAMEDQNIPIAFLGKYHGEFNFLGRMKKSPVELNKIKLEDWFMDHPNGRVIIVFKKNHLPKNLISEYAQEFQDQCAKILTKEQWQTLVKNNP